MGRGGVWFDRNSMRSAPCDQRGEGSAKVDHTGLRPETVPLSSPLSACIPLFLDSFKPHPLMSYPPFSFLAPFSLYFSLAPHCQAPPPPFARWVTSLGLSEARTRGDKVELGWGWGAG